MKCFLFQYFINLSISAGTNQVWNKKNDFPWEPPGIDCLIRIIITGLVGWPKHSNIYISLGLGSLPPTCYIITGLTFGSMSDNKPGGLTIWKSNYHHQDPGLNFVIKMRNKFALANVKTNWAKSWSWLILTF